MRIRGRSLPFPPLLPSSPILPSDPSSSTSTSLFASETDSTTKQPTGEIAPVKIQQVLHPNGDLLQKSSHASQYSSPSSSTSRYTTQVLLKKEEAEERKWGIRDHQEKPDYTILKDEQKECKTMVVKEKNAKRNPAVLLEGSRCSRANGRGWRCCQPTLVGYLLCEHHLGKGRMRNMSNANRGQLGCTDKKRNSSDSAGSADEAVKKKRNIVPTVKARSISSLLDDGNGH